MHIILAFMAGCVILFYATIGFFLLLVGVMIVFESLLLTVEYVLFGRAFVDLYRWITRPRTFHPNKYLKTDAMREADGETKAEIILGKMAVYGYLLILLFCGIGRLLGY